jgi:ethanolamine utilization protein EutL
MRERQDARVTMMKVVPHISAEYRALWQIPEEHTSAGFIACDCEDVMYFALDDASKKAKFKAIYVETVYGGAEYSWSEFGGEITAIISGEKVSDVKTALSYIKNYIEHKSGNYTLNEEGDLGYYIDYTPRAGNYYQEQLGISGDVALGYLVATPVEATYGLDKALKAGNVKIVEFFDAPSRVNTGGALVCGTESACKAAVEAFAAAVEYCCFHPMEIE